MFVRRDVWFVAQTQLRTPPGLIGMLALNMLVARGRSDLVFFARMPLADLSSKRPPS